MVVNPTNLRIHLSLDMNLHLEAVSMHLAAFVLGRQTGQRVGSLKTEILDQSCSH